MARTTNNFAPAAGTAGQFLELPPTSRRRKAPTTTTTTATDATKTKPAATKAKGKAKTKAKTKGKSSAGVKKTLAPAARKKAASTNASAAAVAAAVTAPSARDLRAARRARDTTPISISSGGSTPVPIPVASPSASGASRSAAAPATAPADTFPPPSTTITPADLPSPLADLVTKTIAHNAAVGRLVRAHDPNIRFKGGYLATTVMLAGLRGRSRGWRVRLEELVAAGEGVDGGNEGVGRETLFKVIDGVGGVVDEMEMVERGRGGLGRRWRGRWRRRRRRRRRGRGREMSERDE
ncbi:hypothetical protein BDV97DRAFT_402781 [Delphinella strobiligena]|nr:hypothetical protein BDV97DRAFT_402781 [Delphinella strobiligena]